MKSLTGQLGPAIRILICSILALWTGVITRRSSSHILFQYFPWSSNFQLKYQNRLTAAMLPLIGALTSRSSYQPVDPEPLLNKYELTTATDLYA